MKFWEDEKSVLEEGLATLDRVQRFYRQQLEQAADPQRLRNKQQVREALCVLRQAGEAPGSRSRHRGDPPPLDPSAPIERAESEPFEPGS